MQRYFLVVFLFLSFYSCKENKKEPDKSEVRTILLKDTDNIIELSSIINDIQYIKLETGKESLIGSIIDFKVFNGTFYVLDRIGSKTRILKFSEKGKYLGLFGVTGSGPNEILDPRDIVKENEIFYVWDKTGVHSFSEKGVYLKFMFKAFLAGDKFVYSDRNFYFFHEMNHPGLISKYDINGNRKQIFFPNDFGFGNTESSEIVNIGNSFHFFSPEIDTVYSLCDEHLTPKYIIRCDGIKSFGELLLSKNDMNPYELLRFINKSEYSMIDVFLENEDFIYLSYRYNQKMSHILIDKKTWKQNYYLHCINDLDGGLFDDVRCLTAENKLIILLEPYEILDHFKNNSENLSEHSRFLTIAENTKLTDNPVLMICKINYEKRNVFSFCSLQEKAIALQ